MWELQPAHTVRLTFNLHQLIVLQKKALIKRALNKLQHYFNPSFPELEK